LDPLILAFIPLSQSNLGVKSPGLKQVTSRRRSLKNSSLNLLLSRVQFKFLILSKSWGLLWGWSKLVTFLLKNVQSIGLHPSVTTEEVPSVKELGDLGGREKELVPVDV
jgi:hypothetical protein